MLNEANNAATAARYIHPGLTPLPGLDGDGLLAPPHLAVNRIETEQGKSSNDYRSATSESYLQHDFSTELLNTLQTTTLRNHCSGWFDVGS